MQRHCSLKLFGAAVLASSSLLAHAASIAPVVAQHGMVVSAQHRATQIGVDVLKRGGNAVDAAVVVDYGMTVQEAIDAPRFHQQWLPEATNLERFAVSPDTQKLLEAMGHKFGAPQPANHVVAILIGAPSLGGKPVGDNRFYGANDPRRNTGLAAGY